MKSYVCYLTDYIKESNVNKKLILSIIFSLFCLLPVVAAPNWVQIGNKMYIDTNSVRKENYSNSNYNNYYSVWIKRLNDGSKPFLDTESYYKTKIWFSLQQYYVDCQNKRAAFKGYINYDLKSNAVGQNTREDYNLSFDNIAPGTTGDLMYGFVCQISNRGY